MAVQSPRRLLRDALATCLDAEPDLTVVGKVAAPEELPELCELGHPGAVILDAGPRLSDVARLAGDLVRRFPGLNVIAFYRDASASDLTLAYRAGITSLVPESHGLAGVLPLLRRSSGIRIGIRRGTQGSLTDRERELVMLTSSGHSVAEIAVLLGISPLTVENLKRRVYAKLGVNSSAQAVSRAASLGMLDQRAAPATPPRQRQPATTGSDFPLLVVVSGPPSPALDQVVVSLMANGMPFVLVRTPGPTADAHWVRWNRGPVLTALVDPEPADWDLARELGVPVIVVHSEPLDSAELTRAFASGANSLVPAHKIPGHLATVLRMVGQGYLVLDSQLRSLVGGAREERPELTARETDILQSVARGYSIRQTARALGISPKTVETTQTRLFRKLGVRNRAEALGVVDRLGLLPDTPCHATGFAPAAVPA